MSEFRELSRAEVNDDLWNKLVKKYADGRPYAMTWYLDALGKWKGLVIGNYDIIMPLPYHQKYLFQKRLYQPFLSQWFGPLGKDLSPVIKTQILDYLVAQWSNSRVFLPKGIIGSNQGYNVTNRVNQIIQINNAIDGIRSNYTKTRRSQIRQSIDKMHVGYNSNIDEFLLAYKTAEFPKVKPILKQWKLFKRLLNACKLANCLEIIRVVDLSGQLLTTAAFIVTDTRVINLIGASSDQCRELNGNAIKIDSMISKYCKEKSIFDFFGSNLSGVHAFNKQFGAIEDAYIEIQL